MQPGKVKVCRSCFGKNGFRTKWRGWIEGYLSTTEMSIIINGSPTKPFWMEKGLRQGDLLSLFLFVMVAEVLYKLL